MVPNREKIAGLVLAAGASTRMGKPKQLLPTPEGALLDKVLSEALKSNLDKVVLVLGHRAAEIKKCLESALESPRLEIIENRSYFQGISSSIISGLSIIENSYDHVMILLGDMPFIDAKIINLLIKNYLGSHKPMGALRVKSRRSHPVIFSRSLFPELNKLHGDVGAKALFEKYSDQVCLVEPEDFYDDRDIDTPEDYHELKDKLGFFGK